MLEHLNREQISNLLEHPEGAAGGLEHIAACPECAREYEQMSRMRMALSGLPDLATPVGEWDAIEDRLGLEPLGQAAATPLWRRATSWPLQAAAVLALFAGGLMVGQRISPSSDAPEPIPAVATTNEIADPASSMEIEPAEAYLRTVAGLQHLRDGSDESGSGQTGPAAVAERITHLDGMIDASRAALREAPADPMLNNFLFQLVDERDDLATQLDQTLRMTAAEY
jgi:hypothetical protein